MAYHKPTLRNEKKRYKSIAQELCYDAKTFDDIINASSYDDLDRALISARKRLEEREVKVGLCKLTLSKKLNKRN